MYNPDCVYLHHMYVLKFLSLNESIYAMELKTFFDLCLDPTIEMCTQTIFLPAFYYKVNMQFELAIKKLF